MIRRALCFAVLSLAIALPASAAPFTTTYTFTGSPGDQVSEAVDSNPVGALFADITRGAGIAAEAGANSINSRGWTTGAAIDPNDYYEWAITPLANFAVNVDSIAFTSRRSGTGPLSFELRSSLDAFGASLASFTLPDVTTNIRLTLGLTTMAAPITFRLYGYNAEGPLGTYRLGLSTGDAGSTLPNNLQVSGDIRVVPEPTTVFLLGTGLLIVAVRRRPRI